MSAAREPAPVRGLPGLGRCRVVGILNVTPDSFSDGGAFLQADAAVRRGLQMLSAGADIVDVGGESTRPGSRRVDPQEEWRRIGPVVEALSAAGAVVSVDTMNAATVERAIAAGAQLVNDVTAGGGDPRMLEVVAAAELPYIAMHSRGAGGDMSARAHYRDVVEEVCLELRERLDAAVAAGIDPQRIVLDPGLGFAKTAEHNWTLLAQLDRLLELGRPLLVGASRKSFLGRLLATDPEHPRPVAEREHATAAVSALVAAAGVWAVRVHEVAPSADAVRVAAAVSGARSGS